jgi:hypothetical protein
MLILQAECGQGGRLMYSGFGWSVYSSQLWLGPLVLRGNIKLYTLNILYKNYYKIQLLLKYILNT